MSQGPAAGATNHATLAGLSNDDHSQYLNRSRHASDHAACQVTNSANDSIANNTFEVLTWDQEDFDDSGWHDTVTNNSRVTVDTDGKYEGYANIRFAADATGVRAIKLTVNGTDVAFGRIDIDSAVNHVVTLKIVLDLQANDYIECWAFQNSGGALNVEHGDSRFSYFGVVRIQNATPSGTGGESTLSGLGDTDITAAAKGDMLVYDGTNWVDLTVGSNDQVLTADSAETAGVKWAAAAAGGSTVPDYYSFLADRTVASQVADGDDDEFDDGTFTGWTTVNPSGTVSVTENLSRATFVFDSIAGNDCHAYVKAIPGTPTNVLIEIAWTGIFISESWIMFGPVFSDGTTTTSNVVWQNSFWGPSLTSLDIRSGTFTNVSTDHNAPSATWPVASSPKVSFISGSSGTRRTSSNSGSPRMV